MCGKSIPRRLNAGFQSAECETKSGWTRPRDAAVSRGERENCRARPWPPSSPTGGFASRRQGRSGGWLPFPKAGTVPTTRPSSSGAASRSRSCAGHRDRAAGLRNVPNHAPVQLQLARRASFLVHRRVRRRGVRSDLLDGVLAGPEIGWTVAVLHLVTHRLEATLQVSRDRP